MDTRTPAAPDDAEDEPRAREPVPTGSLKPALIFGVVMATVQMAILLWLLYG